MRQTKLIGLLLGLILSSIPFATFAADAVSKEETTPPDPAGALSPNQIQPIDSAKLIKQATPAAQPAAPAEANPGTVQVEPVAPSAPMQQQTQTAPDSTAVTPSATAMPSAPNQPPAATQEAPVSTAPQQAQPNNAPNAMPAQ